MANRTSPLLANLVLTSVGQRPVIVALEAITIVIGRPSIPVSFSVRRFSLCLLKRARRTNVEPLVVVNANGAECELGVT